MDPKKLGKDYREGGLSRTQLEGVIQQETPAFRAEALRSYDLAQNRNNNNSNSTQSQGSVLDPYAVIKASSGKSKISEMSDYFKTGINNEKELLNKDKLNDAILKQLEFESNLHTEINEGLGLTGELSRSFRDTLIESTPAAAQLGYDIGNITDMMTSLSEKTSKFSLISSNTLDQSFKTSRAFGMTLPQLSEAFSEFEKVGYGAADTLDKINTAGLKSASIGLNSKKTTQDLKLNIEKLNEFGFKNGVEGLNRMVQKSAEFVSSYKAEARAIGREIDVYTQGHVVCRPTRKEAEEYFHYFTTEAVDFGAVEESMRLKGLTRANTPDYEERRRMTPLMNIGYPIVGSPDDVAEKLGRIHGAGITGIGFSLVNYVTELPFLGQELMPRLEKMGMRAPIV
jgi:hypothetical protein